MQVDDGVGDTDATRDPVVGGTLVEASEPIEVSATVARTALAAGHRHGRRPAGALVLDLRPDDEDATDEADPTPADRGSGDPAPGAPSERSAPAAEPASPRPLQGRVAVVTGGAGGLGRVVALDLAAAGARVCVLGRDVAAMRETAALAGPGAAIVTLQCDVGSISEIDGVVDFIDRLDRPVDILVHGEDVHVRGGVEHGSVTDLDEQYLVNLRGPYLLSQRLLDGLREARGHVVFVNAVTAATPTGFAQHTVVHHGVTALADALRAEVGDDGVAVSCIHVEIPDPAGDDPALDPAAVSEVVVGAVAMRDRIDVTDVRVRPRR